MNLSPKDVKDAVEMVPETIERILFTLRYKIDNYIFALCRIFQLSL